MSTKSVLHLGQLGGSIWPRWWRWRGPKSWVTRRLVWNRTERSKAQPATVIAGATIAHAVKLIVRLSPGNKAGDTVFVMHEGRRFGFQIPAGVGENHTLQSRGGSFAPRGTRTCGQVRRHAVDVQDQRPEDARRPCSGVGQPPHLFNSARCVRSRIQRVRRGARPISLQAVKKCYKHLALKLHPDKCHVARARQAFEAVTEARDLLEQQLESAPAHTGGGVGTALLPDMFRRFSGKTLHRTLHEKEYERECTREGRNAADLHGVTRYLTKALQLLEQEGQLPAIPPWCSSLCTPGVCSWGAPRWASSRATPTTLPSRRAPCSTRRRLAPASACR
jgi:hypothetical protein